MPVSQNARNSGGANIARNSFGVAPRTLGGLFSAPVNLTSFGSDPSAVDPFPNNTVQTLGSVNLPAYTFTKASVVRISFAGVLSWNATPGGFAFLRMEVTPNALGLSDNLQLATGLAAVPGSICSFGGQMTLFAQQDPSASALVAVSALTSDIQLPTVPTAPEFKLFQSGFLSLNTTGLASGINFNFQVSLSGGASIGFTQLRYYLTEMVGG
jgi:hypothetical protein